MIGYNNQTDVFTAYVHHNAVWLWPGPLVNLMNIASNGRAKFPFLDPQHAIAIFLYKMGLVK